VDALAAHPQKSDGPPVRGESPAEQAAPRATGASQ
jgi:hypothetical protein